MPLDHLYVDTKKSTKAKSSPAFIPSPAEHTYRNNTIIHQNTSEIACNPASVQQSSTQRYSYITPGEAITIN